MRQARLSPTARPSTATRTSSTCRWRRCCPTPTTPSAASWWASTASMELRPGAIEGFGGASIVRPPRDRAPAPASRRRRAASRPRRERASAGRGARRHRAHRHHRQGRQHVHGDAVGRLAAVSPVIPELGFRSARAAQMFWLDERHARRAGARQAAAHDADADAGAARRRALHELGHAGRRPAGPVELAVLPAPRPSRHEPAGGDRRAGLAHRALPVVVLAAHRPPRRAGGRRPAAARDHRGAASGAATTSRSAPDWSEGRLTAAARDGARRRAAANPRGMQGYAAGR